MVQEMEAEVSEVMMVKKEEEAMEKETEPKEAEKVLVSLV